MELPNWLTEPNAAAYTNSETRGSLRNDSAEKFPSSQDILCTLHEAARRELPKGRPVPKAFRAAKTAVRVKTGW